MSKKQDIYRGHKEKGMWWLDEFEYICTCWANHRNKMKFNKNQRIWIMTIEELYKYAVKHDIEDYDIWFNFLDEYQWESCPVRYIDEKKIDHECKKVFL